MFRRFLILVALGALSGCAQIATAPLPTAPVSSSRTEAIDYDVAWGRAVDWFADHNVIIDKIEKPSGLITARYTIQVGDKYLSCGVTSTSGFIGTPSVKQLGTLNVTVRHMGQNMTRINVNFFGEIEIKGRDQWDGSAIYWHGDCVSTGELERQILDYVTQK